MRLRIETFSVTANNVTYAVVGDAFGYWNFFPGTGEWGVVPMWGHAVVEQSNHPTIAVGERVYGYLPMATHLDVQPSNVSNGGFTDIAAHRQPMSPIYNQYSRLNADPEHDAAHENERMIFGPLFKTGLLIENMMRRAEWFGARTVVITSSSSKTALALASVARHRSPGIVRVGLTSPANTDFVRNSGFYDIVLPYDAIRDLPAVASVSVDFAGNAQLLHTLHTTLGDNLRYSCTVGATHVGTGFGRDNGPIPDPQPVLFFAPDHALAAIKEQGPKAFGEVVAESWRHFLRETEEAVTVDERSGLMAAVDAFHAIHAGRADPSMGIVVRP
ncbi:DUF2855 family protein [Novosphingobium sp.]|uniref:DUF2855 family protein n=1 Tax=Novosphingobium sp. TaxID=1874826 RepID=UPI0025E33A28|nr:DUF2855 family protein [Novosphingobium sp.]